MYTLSCASADRIVSFSSSELDHEAGGVIAQSVDTPLEFNKENDPTGHDVHVDQRQGTQDLSVTSLCICLTLLLHRPLTPHMFLLSSS